MLLIKKIEIKNFKSFSDVTVDLTRFNIIIGTNASGKTNFINIFKFLKDILNDGLDDAISLQGGTEYIKNIYVDPRQVLSIKIYFNEDDQNNYIFKTNFDFNGTPLHIAPKNVNYSFKIQFGKKKNVYNIIDENLIILGDVYNSRKKQIRKITPNDKFVNSGEFRINRIKNKLYGELLFDNHHFKSILSESEMLIVKEDRLSLLTTKMLFLEGLITFYYPFYIKYHLSNINIYNIDPELAKKSIEITSKNKLESNGRNLALVLDKIFQNKKDKEKYYYLIKDILPFIDHMKVEKYFEGRSLITNLKEIYSEKYLPASSISDGTFNIIALIVLLYFEKNRLILVEEPERNVHPYLISKMISMMKEISQDKQIILTTHNPEIVKQANLDDLIFIKRDELGFSQILKPANIREIKQFLKNNLGIQELYIQDLIG